MKSVEFSEENLNDLSEIAKQMFGDENDPRSFAYKRKLVRPHINWLKIICFVLLLLSGAALTFYASQNISESLTISIIAACAVFVLSVLLCGKRIAINMVKIYQRYAPASIREKCRFEPSCSEYMILSIEKYGLIKGVKKGINRLKRCHINDGGFDYP